MNKYSSPLVHCQPNFHWHFVLKFLEYLELLEYGSKYSKCSIGCQMSGLWNNIRIVQWSSKYGIEWIPLDCAHTNVSSFEYLSTHLTEDWVAILNWNATVCSVSWKWHLVKYSSSSSSTYDRAVGFTCSVLHTTTIVNWVTHKKSAVWIKFNCISVDKLINNFYAKQNKNETKFKK